MAVKFNSSLIHIFFSFFCCIILNGTLNATPYVDSLKNEILNSPSQRAHYNFLIARYFHQQTYGYSPNQDSMLHYLNLASTEAKEEGIDTVLARCYMFRGKALSREGLFAESNEIVEQAKLIFKRLGDSIYVSKMDYIISYNYMDLGMDDIGISYLEKAIIRSGNSEDTLFVASMNMAMGSFLTSKMKFRESRPYTKRAIQQLSEKKPLEVGGAYYNIANSFYNEEEFDSSYYYFQKALDIWKSINYKRGEGILYSSLAESFSKQKKHDRAIDYLLKSESILLDAGDKRRLKDAYLKIADNYLLLNNVQQAKTYIEKAEAQGLEHSPFTFFHELDRLKAKMYEQFGDYKNAYKHQVEFLKRADTIVKQESENRVLESDRRLEFLRKTKDLEVQAISVKALEQEKQLLEAKQNLYLIIFGFIILVAGLFFFYLNKRKRYEIEIQEISLNKSKELNTQLQKEIEFRRKKLSSYALQLIDKNQKLDDVKKDIEALRKSSSEKKVVDDLFNLEKSVDKAINTEQSWEEFKLYFEEVHTGFFSKIKSIHSGISSRELRLSALLRLNLSTKEIANLLNLPTKTIEVARYRLRKKLELKQEDNLVEYIMSI